jgi:pantetheine-phosphate adenylyltransferase
MTAVYPGTFDPVTLGHLDIIRRAAKVVERLIVAVADNPSKRTMFTACERIELIKHETAHMQNVTVKMFSGMLASFILSNDVDVIIRGVRSCGDLQNERIMARFNLELTKGTDTWFLASGPEFSHISSSAVKETAGLIAQSGFNTDIMETLVSERVIQALTTRK